MKIYFMLLFIVFNSCIKGSEYHYTGSTPAGNMARAFLGIPFSDSVDFIRWKLTLQNNNYQLHCSYGIGKPNTNGFINGGKKIELHGVFEKKTNYYQLSNGNKVLQLAILNDNLLHLADGNNLLAGNGGWSYTLNNMLPVVTGQVNFIAQQNSLKDSMAFEGRTPCGIPAIITPGTNCYKLKWLIVLFADTKNNQPLSYRIRGTALRSKGDVTGNWRIITGKDNRIVYQLNDEHGNALVYLLKPEEHILLFTDERGNLLTGDEDFSYTLNYKW